MTTALKIKELKKNELMGIPGVVGTGISRSSPERINIYVEEMTPQMINKIPTTIDSVPTQIIETGGPFKALQLLEMARPLEKERTDKWRPAGGGVSIGHYQITAGTLGVVCFDSRGRKVILSNCHVLANSDSIQNTRTSPNAPILQPGPYDSGKMPEDQIGVLSEWVKLDETGYNTVDAAIALPFSPDDVSQEILEIGTVKGVKDPVENMEVKKSGRTTGLNTGRIIDTNATISVGYGEFTTTFDDQIITTAMASGGDSGSLIVDTGNHAVGLLFAGSTNLTASNKISNVINALGISFPGVRIAGISLLPFALSFGALPIYWLYRKIRFGRVGV